MSKRQEKEKKKNQRVAKGIGGFTRAADTYTKRTGDPYVKEHSSRACAASAETKFVHAADFGLRVAGAHAGASVADANAGTSVTRFGASAGAQACGAQAHGRAVLLEDVFEANARAVAAEAKANAEAGVGIMGAHAEAKVTTARVEAGIMHTPLKVHAEGPGAGVETGAAVLGYSGATIGAHAGEVRAGPFGARAGVKFGAGIRDGVPEVDMGPVTGPCVVM